MLTAMEAVCHLARLAATGEEPEPLTPMRLHKLHRNASPHHLGCRRKMLQNPRPWHRARVRESGR